VNERLERRGNAGRDNGIARSQGHEKEGYRVIAVHLVRKAGYLKKTARIGAVTLIRK